MVDEEVYEPELVPEHLVLELVARYNVKSGDHVDPDVVRECLQDMGQHGLITWERPTPARPSSGEELWAALQLQKNDQVTDAVLLARISNFEDGTTSISTGATDGCDWVTQLGIMHAGLLVITQAPLQKRDEED